ncbi:MAG: tRNA (adenosine(37)-N6)-threonylcarbamoyltransferase complex ATPase subunit type 1 TsaE [Peptococcaceae bacterium]|nr:tRNA (adenosine(37)-N6)-threonylcarbamoyltransferase complex ATPase subunit type 1 TsaE [Peptococcaceae bacterium]
MAEHVYKTSSPEETIRLGQNLARTLNGGEIICLYGDLGAGKTVLAKGLGVGLGVKQEITSPTFTLIQEYPTSNEKIAFVHMDLYRLQHPEEAEIIGVTDYFRDDCICLIEWPEIISDFIPNDRIEIVIQGSGELQRSIIFNTNYSEDYEISND